MLKDNLYLKEEARDGIMNGIKKASAAVSVTMGTSGTNSLIEYIESPGFSPVNDGATILSKIRFQNPLEELGRKILLEAVGRANRSSGDGSSTATVLTAAILEEGMKQIGTVAPMDLKRSLEECLPLIEASLKAQRKDLIDTDGNIDLVRLEQVATISAEDNRIGKMIAEIYSKIGKDGIINWEASKTATDSYSVGTGIKIDGATYFSRYMADLVNGEPTKQATLETPYVMLVNTKITSQDEMGGVDKSGRPFGFIGKMVEAGIKELVIFTNEMDAGMVNSFVLARAPQLLGIRFLIIKMPVVYNDEWWEDLALATGAKIISPSIGLKVKQARIEDLGIVGKVIVTAEDTFIDGIKNLSDHIKELETEGSDQAITRARRLNIKSAKYFVGGNSESALHHKILKVEDAINAAHCALQNGILPGGGVALLNAVRKIENDVLGEALQAPYKQILKNAGIENGFRGFDTMIDSYGYDTKTSKLVEMFSVGIVDSFDVVLGAVKNAVSVAAGVLTCGTVVLLSRDDNSVDNAIRNILQNPN